MKKTISSIAVGWAMLAATTASAYMVGASDVGGLDTLVTAVQLNNSSDASELAWVNSVLNPDVQWVIKSEMNPLNTWVATTTNNVYAFDLKQSPGISEYFLIKTGNNTSTPNTHFLFRNEANFDWAVVDLVASFGAGATIKNIGKFSHVDEFNTTTPPPPVPEPGTFVLLGAGLAGLAIYTRRRQSK